MVQKSESKGAAHVAFLLSSLKFGGGERVALNLGHAFKAKGLNVSFVLMSHEGEFLAEASEHFNVVDLQCDRTWKLPFKLGAYLLKARPDGLIASFWKLNLCACLARIVRPSMRLLLWEHSPPSKSVNSPVWLYAPTASLLYPLATKVITVSNGVRDDIASITIGLRTQLKVIFNPIPPPVVTDDIVQRNTMTGRQLGRRILWIGRLDSPKNPGLMLEAFALLPREYGFTLDFIGDGPLREDLQSLTTALGLDKCVHIHGFQADTYKWMQQADMLVLSSDREGLPTVLVEALYCGLGIVSTDCGGGIHEVLRNGQYGAIVPPHEPAALAEAIASMAENLPESVGQIAGASRFHPAKIADQFLAVLNGKVQLNSVQEVD